MSKKTVAFLLSLIFGACMLFISGCAEKDKTLTVYSGKGLTKPMEEIKVAFEKRHNITLNIIFGGSLTLLRAIEETTKGDVFIPGSIRVIRRAIKKEGDILDNHQFVALHIPIICVQKDNPKGIHTVNDLARPGIRLTVGNVDMCTIGKVSDSIIAKSKLKEDITKNIVIRSAIVNELLNLMIKKEVNAAIIWKDMLHWPEAKNLTGIEITADMNEIKEVHVAVLKMSEDKKDAQLFADFVASEGKAIFKKHGFGEK